MFRLPWVTVSSAQSELNVSHNVGQDRTGQRQVEYVGQIES